MIHLILTNPSPLKDAVSLLKSRSGFLKFKKFSQWLLAALLAVVLLWAVYIFAYGNFHRVDKDFYRSAQLFPHNMSYFIQKNNIKSVLNLRGASSADWYRDEIQLSEKLGIAHYNYRISDRKALTRKQMDDIVAIIEKAPKPILVHCKAGADRASLATALYLHAIKKNKDADKAFSLRYGHFPWLGSRTKAMGESFAYYKEQNLLERDVFALDHVRDNWYSLN